MPKMMEMAPVTMAVPWPGANKGAEEGGDDGDASCCAGCCCAGCCSVVVVVVAAAGGWGVSPASALHVVSNVWWWCCCCCLRASLRGAPSAGLEAIVRLERLNLAVVALCIAMCTLIVWLVEGVRGGQSQRGSGGGETLCVVDVAQGCGCCW